VLGATELAADSRYRTNPARVANRALLTPVLHAHTSRRQKEEFLAALEASGVPAGPINPLAEVFLDPQIAARGMRIDLASPAGAPVPGLRTPVLIDGQPIHAARPSPALGADGDHILRDPAWIG